MAKQKYHARFATDFKEQPYWWDDAPRPCLETELPSRAEVAVIGSGYSGLCAALQTARGGRHTVVLEAGDVGHGCSTRNGGQVSTSLKPGYGELAMRYGAERALDILREGHNALAWIAQFISDEKIDCAFAQNGRFFGAHTAMQYKLLERRLANMPKGLQSDAFMVPRALQHNEVGTDVYFGGAVFKKYASLHPARYHQGLLARTLTAGAEVIANCRVINIKHDSNGFVLHLDKSGVQCDMRARDVLVATSGYTGKYARALMPWLRRRVIPISSSIIATEEIAPHLMRALLPRQRIVTDSRKMVYYYRASPNGKRMLFGGRTHAGNAPLKEIATRLHTEMTRLFPQLATTRLSHAWTGYIGYTFDQMPHLGQRDGIYYALGYCGSGVSLASYFGTRIGQQILGLSEGQTALDELHFPQRAYYNGTPWFLAPVILYYRWHDRWIR